MAKYDKYKDSGVEWLGEIPSHWNLYSLKRSVDKCTNGFWGAEPDGINDLCVLRVADFNRDNFLINENKLTFRSIQPKEAENRLLKKGDLLIEKSGGGDKTLVGCVVMFDKEFSAITSNFVAKMTPNINTDSKYLTYSFAHLYSGRVNFPSIKQTTGIQNLDSEAYLIEKFGFPPKNEQIQISNFLDYETSKIDDLIAKQEKLIELLKEKRQAVISHAVTKGLNPNVPMKDSGVEWLGQVPEHWKICSLSKIFSIKAGGDVQTRLFSEIQTDEHKFPIYTNANNANSIYGYSKIANYSANSITVSGRGDVGFAVYRDHAFDAIIRLLVLTPQKTCYTKYFAYFINEVIDFKVESSAIGQLSTLQISPYKILFPPFDEQKLITEYLDNETIKIDTLIHKAESVIQLMQERRTVLISSAVTGKIDVRNWQNPTEAKMEFSA